MRAATGPAGLVHGDYLPGNVLVRDGALAAIVDWEEAQLDWPTWDLANVRGTVCEAGDDLDRDACRVFLEDYRSAGGTAPVRGAPAPQPALTGAARRSGGEWRV